MSRRSHPARVFAIATLVAAGLMSLMAANAQAGWLIWLGELTSGETKQIVAYNHTTSKLVVKALNIEIRCTAASSSGLTINGNSSKETAEATGGVVFQLCTSYSAGNEQPKCKPQEPISVGLKASVILHNTKNYVLINNGFKFGGGGEVGLPLTTIVLPGTCALAETSNVTGSLVAECGALEAGTFVGENCSIQRTVHLLRPAPEALFFFDKLKFGANAAQFEGIGAVELASKEFWSGEV